MARFNRPDPYDGSYDPTNPQSWNRYVYAINDPLSLVDPEGLGVCSVNVQVKNQTNLGADALLSIENRINQIFGATTTPNGDSTAANFISGSGDYTLQFSQNGPAGIVGETGGWGPLYWGAATVYMGTAQGAYGTSFLIGAGTVGAHELTHRIGHIGDLPYNPSLDNRNLMNADSANKQGVSSTPDDINPNVQGFAKLTADQAAKLYNQCLKLHPLPWTPRPKGGGMGGGFGGGPIFFQSIYYSSEGISYGAGGWAWYPGAGTGQQKGY